MSTAIRAEGLCRKYGKKVALRDLDLEVPEGSVFGLVGPNGSGKTTAIRCILGLLRPNRGRVTVFGEPSVALSPETRRRIGYLSEEPFPYDDLPVDDLLRFVSAFFPAWDWERSRDLLERMEVPRTQVLREMSAGQRRRAELLLALAQDPDLLVLDDPTAGLDVTVRRDFLRGALELAREEGKTVLFTSHILTDVERIVDTIGFLVGGTMRLVAPLDELKGRTKRIVFEGDDAPPRLAGELAREAVPGGTAVVTGEFGDRLADRLRAQRGPYHVEDMDLEDIFLAVVGRAAEASG
jgi:ABC-2 type transport system ATP-binding protein